MSGQSTLKGARLRSHCQLQLVARELDAKNGVLQRGSKIIGFNPT
jgi:hypothetical protein